jgi:alkylated DNA repair dioxygenase AlkB
MLMEPLYNPIVKRIFTEEESKEILEFLKEKAYVYHRPYKRYNKMVKVPRGQASFTLNENIHYNYGRIAGGSSPNEIMCDRLKEITQRVNMVMGRNYNTILMNVYKNGKDAIGAHQDNENGWVKGTGFATLAFGCERPFVICEIATKNKEKIIHKSGEVIEFPYPMNSFFTHQVPSCSKAVDEWRISLTFREIEESVPA